MIMTPQPRTFEEAVERALATRIARYGRVRKCTICGEEFETDRKAMAHFSRQERAAVQFQVKTRVGDIL